MERKFKELGIINTDDISYIEESDFENILTPIQIRKVHVWKERLNNASDSLSSTGSGSSLPVLLAPAPSAASTSTFSTSSESSDFNQNAEWAETVPLPFSKILPKHIVNELTQDGKISSESRRKLVRNIVEEIRRHSTNVSSVQFRIIARRTIQKYDCLKDVICGKVIGSGYDSLASQLVYRNDNCNRGTTPFGRKKRKPTEEDSKTLTKRDSYGCVKFAPTIDDTDAPVQETIRMEMIANDIQDYSEIEERLKVTYPLQRKEINSQEFDVAELHSRWPLLFVYEGFVLHFKLLTGIEITEVFDKFLDEKADRLITFFGEESNTTGMSKLSIIMNGVLKKMKEKKEDFLVLTDAKVTDKTVSFHQDMPKIIATGPTIDAADEFYVIVDGEKLASVRSLRVAFICYLSLYYVLNIKYPEKIEATLEFFQRAVLGINPQLGSKGKKRKSTVNAKVLKFISEISEFEWTSSQTT